MFVRSLCWPELETWQCLCSLTEDAGRQAGHIKTQPGKAMAMGIVPCHQGRAQLHLESLRGVKNSSCSQCTLQQHEQGPL